jgi:hypothetical protein
MRAFHAEPNPIKRDEIAGRQLHVFQNFQPARTKKGASEMFERLKDHA